MMKLEEPSLVYPRIFVGQEARANSNQHDAVLVIARILTAIDISSIRREVARQSAVRRSCWTEI